MHPEVPDYDSIAAQDTADVVGWLAAATNGSVLVRVPPGGSRVVAEAVTLTNLGDGEERDVRVQVAALTSPNLTVTPLLLSTAVLGWPAGRTSIRLVLNSTGPPGERIPFMLSVTSASGSQAAIRLWAEVEEARAAVEFLPSTLRAVAPPGASFDVVVRLANAGNVPAGPLDWQPLPDTFPASLAAPSPLPSLPVGSTRELRFTVDVPFSAGMGTKYEAGMPFATNSSATSAPWTLPISIFVGSGASASLTMVVVDEYTYFAEGAPRVSGASVSLRAADGVVVASAATDANGTAELSQVPQDTYWLDVSAPGHGAVSQRLFVTEDSSQQVFLPRDAVQVTFTVVPTTYE